MLFNVNIKNAIVTILLLLSGIDIYSQVLDATKIREKCLPGVVLVNSGFSQGSGFQINNGYIVTNHHVIDNSYSSIYVKFENEKQYRCEVEDYDADVDLALLRIEPNNESIIPLLKEGDAEQAQEVVAIGCPLGREFTLTKGVVSSTKVTDAPDYLLQTDAALNSGNSGGPLINKNGNIIGVVVAKIKDVGVEGMAYAIKVSELREFLIKNNVEFATTPLILDAELIPRELSEEEKIEIKKKELARIEAENTIQLKKFAGELAIEEMTQEQKKKLKEIEFEHNRQKLLLQNQIDLQRIEEQKQREKLDLEKDQLELEYEKEKLRISRKQYIATRPYRISTKIGGGLKYLAGDYKGIELPGSADFTWAINGMLGYRFDIDSYSKKARSNTIGIFSSIGETNNNDLNTLLHYTNTNGELIVDQEKSNLFVEFEGGILIREWFRISGGYAIQNISSIEEQVINFYTTSLGVVGRVGLFEGDLVFSCGYGEDLNTVIVRTALSLNLHFKYAKW